MTRWNSLIPQGNCKKDENGNLLPPRDPSIYECEDMTAAERESARKRARDKPENNPKPISPSLTNEQWITVFTQTA